MVLVITTHRKSSLPGFALLWPGKLFVVLRLDNRVRMGGIYLQVASQFLEARRAHRHHHSAAPRLWHLSRNWGYYPSGGLGMILLIVVILWLLHVI
jgi:hypothetical protein